MRMIFPGMDPYLEKPELWMGVHNRLIVYIADLLNPMIQPRYIAAIEGRVYLEGTERSPIPDVRVSRTPARDRSQSGTATLLADAPVRVVLAPEEVVETYITLLDREQSLNVVTVMEVLSPKNKRMGPGRDSYTQKQREVRSSDVHLVEIDLLRAGRHVLIAPEGVARESGPYDYLVCVNPGEGSRAECELYPSPLRDRLPRIAVPLAGDDADVTLDLQAAIEQTYERGIYRNQIDYSLPCVPRLSASDQTWADGLIREAIADQPPPE